MDLIIIRKQAIRRLVDVIANVIANCRDFKIGKTGDTVENRRSESDYADEYPYVERLYSSRHKFMVDFMEAMLIDIFHNHPKCTNDKNGSRSINDRMTKKVDMYSVYIVWK